MKILIDDSVVARDEITDAEGKVVRQYCRNYDNKFKW